MLIRGTNIEKEKEVRKFYMDAGFLPQNDIVWDTFTVDQNIRMYSRIRRIPDEVIEEWKIFMDLDKFGNRLA